MIADCRLNGFEIENRKSQIENDLIVPRYHHTEGVCLRRLDFSNTSQIATFLTPDAGRMSFMAKGATRAPRRGIRCGFDLLARYDIIYTTPRSGSLQNLTARSMLESFHPMRGALERMLCGYYAAELALNFTSEADPCPGLYGTLVESLRGFAAGERLGLGVLLLELAALKEHGTCPAFDECASCQGRLREGGRAGEMGRGARGEGRLASFSPSHGGPLCRRCVRGIPAGPATPLLPVSTRRLALLADLAAHPTRRADAGSIPPKHIVAAGRLLRFHMQYLLGKELRMWKYLQQRHMSRTLERIRRAARAERA